MGSYTFKWEHPANEVFVTGTFDDWKKTVQLEKKDSGFFEKTVQLPEADKILYKFVVDGNWTTNDSAPTESDGSILNNVLNPSDIKPATISSAAPDSSTAAMAAEVPKEAAPAKEVDQVPGTFPETPFETPAGEPQQFSVNPIPATEGAGNPVQLAPGDKVPDPSTLTNNTISSTVESDADLKKPEEKKEEEGEKTLSVNPIPASEGLGNPIQLAPGEKVPEASEITSKTVNGTVSSDSYDKPDALPTDKKEKEEPNGMFGVPPVTSTLIPESSLPIGGEAPKDTNAGPTIQSAAPESSTAALAAAVPKEPQGVPEVVTDSQKEAHAEPEAAANPAAVVDKKEVEAELKETVPEAPAAATSTSAAKDETPAVPAAAVPEEVKESIEAAHASPEAAANPEAVKEKSAVEAELKKEVPEVEEAGEPAPTASTVTATPAAAVPEEVKESIEAAHTSPEAAANPEAVKEKSAVEAELKKEVPEVEEAGEPAPTVSAATTETAPQKTESGGLSPDALGHDPLKSSSEEVGASKKEEPTTVLSVQPSDPALASGDISPKTTTADKPAETAAKEEKPSDSAVPDSKPTEVAATEDKPTEPKATEDKPAEGTPAETKPAEETKPAPATPAKSEQATPTKKTDTPEAKKKKNRVSGFFKKLKEKF